MGPKIGKSVLNLALQGLWLNGWEQHLDLHRSFKTQSTRKKLFLLWVTWVLQFCLFLLYSYGTDVWGHFWLISDDTKQYFLECEGHKDEECNLLLIFIFLGNMNQNQRLDAMAKLKQFHCRVLISTDLVSFYCFQTSSLQILFQIY